MMVMICPYIGKGCVKTQCLAFETSLDKKQYQCRMGLPIGDKVT